MTGQSDRDSFEIELAIESEMGREMQREAQNCCSLGDNKSLRLMTSRQEKRESQDWSLDTGQTESAGPSPFTVRQINHCTAAQ